MNSGEILVVKIIEIDRQYISINLIVYQLCYAFSVWRVMPCFRCVHTVPTMQNVYLFRSWSKVGFYFVNLPCTSDLLTFQVPTFGRLGLIIRSQPWPKPFGATWSVAPEQQGAEELACPTSLEAFIVICSDSFSSGVFSSTTSLAKILLSSQLH